MAKQQTPLTIDSLFEYLQQSSQDFDRRLREEERLRKEAEAQRERERQARERERKASNADWERRQKILDQKISSLGSRIGEIVENMIGGDIVNQFRALGYDVKYLSRNLEFGYGTPDYGEIDLILEDGDVVILIEVKTNLKTADVRDHVKRLEKYRRLKDASGSGKYHRYVGAVAGAVVAKNVAEFAQKQGMYVIVQSGQAVEILPSPEGFVAKMW